MAELGFEPEQLLQQSGLGNKETEAEAVTAQSLLPGI